MAAAATLLSHVQREELRAEGLLSVLVKAKAVLYFFLPKLSAFAHTFKN